MKNEYKSAGVFADSTIAEVLIAEYKEAGKHGIRFPVYMNSEMSGTDISALDLNHRSFNCLKRPGISTIGQLVDSVDTMSDLLKFRGLGTKSAAEIMYRLYLYQYSVLSPERREQYIKEVIELNK